MTIRVSKRVEMDGKTVDMTVEAEFDDGQTCFPGDYDDGKVAQHRAMQLFASMDFPLQP